MGGFNNHSQRLGGNSWMKNAMATATANAAVMMAVAPVVTVVATNMFNHGSL